MKKRLTVALTMFTLDCEEQSDPTSAIALSQGALSRVSGHADGFILDDGQDHVGGTIVITAPEFTVGEGCGEVFIAGDRFEVTDQVELKDSSFWALSVFLGRRDEALGLLPHT